MNGEHCPIDLPDPIEAIKIRLEQQGKDTRALIGVIGHRTRVHEVLNGKRSLSLKMIRNLHDKFGIPANVLIQPAQKMRKRSGRHRSRAVTNRLRRPRKGI
jgi:HTH-type transcriptional regulator/antitoxin HigA